MKQIDKVFKVLADPSRRALIDRLHKRGGQPLTELCEGLDMARQSVTQHLGLLEEANLISVEWRGREKLHYFNPVPIYEIYVRWIRKFEEPRLEALHHLKTKLERNSNEQREVHLHDLHRHDAGEGLAGAHRGGTDAPILDARKRVRLEAGQQVATRRRRWKEHRQGRRQGSGTHYEQASRPNLVQRGRRR